MRRLPALTVLLFTLAATAVVVAVFASSAVAGWGLYGNFEGESLALVDGASIVSNKNASGGQALRLTTGSSVSTDLYVDPDRDALATSITVRVKDVACGGSDPEFAVWIDGEYVMSRRAQSGMWTQRTAPLPDSLVNDPDWLGSTHTWRIKFLNPYSSARCTRALDIDLAGWWVIGSVFSTDMTVSDGNGSAVEEGADTWQRVSTPRAPSKQGSGLRVTGNVMVDAPELAQGLTWGNKIRVIAFGTPCNGQQAVIEASLGDRVLGRRTLKDVYGESYFDIPDGVAATDLHVRLVNPGSFGTCTRAATLDWAVGTIGLF